MAFRPALGGYLGIEARTACWDQESVLVIKDHGLVHRNRDSVRRQHDASCRSSCINLGMALR
jgi:hypothetical protein